MARKHPHRSLVLSLHMKFELGEERAVETRTAVHCTPKPNEDDDGTNSKRICKTSRRNLAGCKRVGALASGATLLLALAANQIAFADVSSRKTLSGHFPKAARQLTPRAPLPSDSQLSLVLGLPLNDAAGLEEFLQRVYEPRDPLYRIFYPRMNS